MFSFAEIKKSTFLKNVAVLTTGTAVSQAILLAASPLLSRLYSPEEFGDFAVFSSLFAIIAVIATLRYELAIVLPEKETDAFALIKGAIIISLVVSLIALAGISVFYFYTGKTLSTLFFLVPPLVFLSGAIQAFSYFLIRNKEFVKSSVVRVANAFCNSAVSLILGYKQAGKAGLIAGLISGQAASAVILFYRNKYFSKQEKTKTDEIKSVLRQHKDFPYVNAPHALIEKFYDDGIVFFLAYFFSLTVLGWYAFAFRMLKAPVGLIGSAIYQVFYQKASEYKNEGKDVSALVIKIYSRLFLFALPIFGGLFFISPALFAFVFGEEWRGAGEIAQILMPWLFFNFIASPVSCLTLVYKKQKQAFVITIIDMILRFSALILCGLFTDYKTAFIITSGIGTCVMIFAILWYYKISKP